MPKRFHPSTPYTALAIGHAAVNFLASALAGTAVGAATASAEQTNTLPAFEAPRGVNRAHTRRLQRAYRLALRAAAKAGAP